jgi:hypothetical protein
MPPDPPLGDEEDEPNAAEEETVDAADTATLQQQRKKRRRAEDAARDFWHAVFAIPDGRREMWRLLHEDMHAFETQFGAGPNGSPDPYGSWYQRGKQDLGLRLYQRWLALEPAAVLLMHQENDPRFAKPKPAKRQNNET